MMDDDDVEHLIRRRLDWILWRARDDDDLDDELRRRLDSLITDWCEDWLRDHRKHYRATTIRISVQGDQVASTFTIQHTDTGAQAVLQFTDNAGNPVAGPMDSVNTGTPITPTVESSDPGVVTVGAATQGTSPAPGEWFYPLTPVASGQGVQLSVAPLTNSDGSPVLEPSDAATPGAPFGLPAPITINVSGDATGLTITEVG